MKAIIKSLAVLLLLTEVIVCGQTADFYQNKIKRFKPMKTIGISLMVASVPLGALGTAFIIDSENTSDDLEGVVEFGGKYIAGYIFLGCAVASIAAGTALTIISSVMMKKYRTKLDSLKVGAYITPNQAGFTLTFRL
jgi:hypothetical protein